MYLAYFVVSVTKIATIEVSNEKQVDWYTFRAVFVQLTTPPYLNLNLLEVGGG